MKKKKDYDFTVPVIVIVGLFVLTLLLNAVVMPKRTLVNAQYASPSFVAYGGSAHLFILDQKVAGQVSILSAALKQSGFVVISNEKTGEIVGVSPLFVPGMYSNRSLLLSKSVTPGDELFASIYTDNGDGKFDPNTVDDMMEPTMMWFTAL